MKSFSDDQKIKVLIENKEIELDAQRGFSWSEPIYDTAGSECFLIKQINHGDGFYDFHSVVRVNSSKMETILEPKDLGEDSSITEILKVYDEGKKLQVVLHFISKKEGNSTFYDTKPVMLEISTKQIKDMDFSGD